MGSCKDSWAVNKGRALYFCAVQAHYLAIASSDQAAPPRTPTINWGDFTVDLGVHRRALGFFTNASVSQEDRLSQETQPVPTSPRTADGRDGRATPVGHAVPATPVVSDGLGAPVGIGGLATPNAIGGLATPVPTSPAETEIISPAGDEVNEEDEVGRIQAIPTQIAPTQHLSQADLEEQMMLHSEPVLAKALSAATNYFHRVQLSSGLPTTLKSTRALTDRQDEDMKLFADSISALHETGVTWAYIYDAMNGHFFDRTWRLWIHSFNFDLDPDSFSENSVHSKMSGSANGSFFGSVLE
jgi:hypothetical protein